MLLTFTKQILYHRCLDVLSLDLFHFCKPQKNGTWWFFLFSSHCWAYKACQALRTSQKSRRKSFLAGWIFHCFLSCIAVAPLIYTATRGDNWAQHGHRGWGRVAGTWHHSCSGIQGKLILGGKAVFSLLPGWRRNVLRTVALHGHNGERERSRMQIPFLPRSLGFIFLVRVHHTTGNYASFLPHFPGFDFSSSCVAQLVQVKLFYSIKSCLSK